MPILVTQDEFNQIAALFQITGTGVDPAILKKQALTLVAARSTGTGGSVRQSKSSAIPAAS